MKSRATAYVEAQSPPQNSASWYINNNKLPEILRTFVHSSTHRAYLKRLSFIRSLINASSLSQTVKARSISIFERLAVAEAKVHGTTPDKVHFHEVGAVDSIVDTVGAMIGFELLGVDRFNCSSLRVGGGSIETEHGLLPIPSPATAELLRGAPVYAGEIDGEFVTPTGAAIVATLCEQFSSLPSMKVMNIGYGAGTR